jgi:hypothetical protein
MTLADKHRKYKTAPHHNERSRMSRPPVMRWARHLSPMTTVGLYYVLVGMT